MTVRTVSSTMAGSLSSGLLAASFSSASTGTAVNGHGVRVCGVRAGGEGGGLARRPSGGGTGARGHRVPFRACGVQGARRGEPARVGRAAIDVPVSFYRSAWRLQTAASHHKAGSARLPALRVNDCLASKGRPAERLRAGHLEAGEVPDAGGEGELHVVAGDDHGAAKGLGRPGAG